MHTKFPETAWPFWISIAVLALIFIGLCRLTRWCYLIAAPISLLAVFNGWRLLLTNDHFRENIIRELGLGYFVSYAAHFLLPLVVLAAYAYWDFKVRKKPGIEPSGKGGGEKSFPSGKQDKAQTSILP